MSSSDDDNVPLYNALERNQNRRKFVVAFSSSSESDSDDEETSFFVHSPPDKRARQRGRESDASDAAPAESAPDANESVVVLEEEEEEECGVDLLSEHERELERQKELEVEAEIQWRIAQDALLNQTKAIMSKTSTMQKQFLHNGTVRDIISLDSEDEDDGVAIPAARPSAPARTETASVQLHDKGERITLLVRSNGASTAEIAMGSKEPFEVLYERFCDQQGLPRSAVRMTLDGEALRLQDTPSNCDLDSGDLIDAKVDFSQQDTQKKRNLVRLRLIVSGRRPEVFKIDMSTTIDKLHASFCKKHQIEDPEDVELRLHGEPLSLHETVEACGLADLDEIDVEIHNFIDPSTIELTLRFQATTTKEYHVVPNHKVSVLVDQVASEHQVASTRVCLQLDGETMDPQRAFAYYDLEGGELVEVKIRP